MTSWIDLHALWRIVLLGLVCGAGLPAVFAVGLKALAFGEHATVTDAGTPVVTRSPLSVVVSAVCFAVVLAAIAWGIYLIVDGT